MLCKGNNKYIPAILAHHGHWANFLFCPGTWCPFCEQTGTGLRRLWRGDKDFTEQSYSVTVLTYYSGLKLRPRGLTGRSASKHYRSQERGLASAGRVMSQATLTRHLPRAVSTPKIAVNFKWYICICMYVYLNDTRPMAKYWIRFHLFFKGGIDHAIFVLNFSRIGWCFQDDPPIDTSYF